MYSLHLMSVMPVSFNSLLFVVVFVFNFASLSSPASAFKVMNFSAIQQCGPFTISFAGGKPPAALPLNLTVIPFDSPPIFIPILDPVWNDTTSTGVAVTFLPLAAKTKFIASLDDAQGQGAGRVSDIHAILDSQNTSCIQSSQNSTTDLYTISSGLTQCASFNVSYNVTTPGLAVSVRAFTPNGSSYYLNQTQLEQIDSLTSPGTWTAIATYEMTALRGDQVLLLFNDSSGYHESSGLKTVQGDTTTNTSCLSFFSGNGAAASQSKSGLSRNAVVAIAATICSVVAVVAILMGIFAYRNNRQGKEMKGIEGGPGFDYPRGLGPIPPSPPMKMAMGLPSKTLKDPPYPIERYTTSPLSPYFVQTPPKFEDSKYVELEGSVYDPSKSFGGISPSTNRHHFSNGSLFTAPFDVGKRRSPNSPMDIEHILNLATLYTPTEESGPRTPETPRSPYQPISPAIVSPTRSVPVAMRKEEPQVPLPVSPSPPSVNFRDSDIVRETYSLYEAAGMVAMEKDGPVSSRKSDPESSPRSITPPGRAITSDLTEPPGMGIGVGRDGLEGYPNKL